MIKSLKFILKKINFFIFLCLFAILFEKNVVSVEPDEILKNSKHELRARNISKNIRCMICQNQSIDESSSPLAKDLRVLIRIKIAEGFNDKEIYQYLADRYGTFVLLKPPLNINTLALWFLPFIFLLIGVYLIIVHNSKSKELR